MSAVPNLLYSDVEDELRATVRSLLDDRSSPEAVLQRIEGDEPYDPALWNALATDVGAVGLPVAEDAGGVGASWREAAVVAEEIGRAVAGVPFLGSAVLATRLLTACGETELLEPLAGGKSTAAVATPLSTAPGSPFPSTVTSDRSGVSGTVMSVADALVADWFIVPAVDGEQRALYVVESTAATVERVVSMDLTRPLCTVMFQASPARRVAAGDAAVAAFDAALLTAAAVLASEQFGVAQRCLEMTVEYLKSRYQFGRPVGSFQALKHRLADLWVAVTQARAVARYAAACVADDHPDAEVAVAVAQAQCSAVAVLAAEECVQMHGGIGFTWEHPAHLYLKRAKTTAIALGTPDWHRRRLATLVDLPPAE